MLIIPISYYERNILVFQKSFRNVRSVFFVRVIIFFEFVPKQMERNNRVDLLF